MFDDIKKSKWFKLPFFKWMYDMIYDTNGNDLKHKGLVISDNIRFANNILYETKFSYVFCCISVVLILGIIIVSIIG